MSNIEQGMYKSEVIEPETGALGQARG